MANLISRIELQRIFIFEGSEVQAGSAVKSLIQLTIDMQLETFNALVISILMILVFRF